MKLKTTLVPFLLSFFLVGCYSNNLMLPEGNAEPNRLPLADRWAADVVEAEVPGWLGQAKGPPTDAERDALVAEGGGKVNQIPIVDRWTTDVVEPVPTSKKAQNILKFKVVNKCPYCDLSGVDFSDLKLKTADLTNANLTGADLRNADLWLADFVKANLTDADLSGANLTSAYFWNANLTNANLTGADLKGAKLEGAIFCNTKTPWGLDNSGCGK